MEMIDEKRLEEYAAMAESSERGFCFGYGRVDREELRAIIRLARLGLWAERHGVRAVNAAAEVEGQHQDAVGEALAALKAVGA
jgi:hypothetical protein